MTYLDPDSMPPALASQFATRHTHGDLVAGVNDDDCAVLRWLAPLLVVTTDFVNASPIAMEFGIGNEETIGRLAVAANSTATACSLNRAWRGDGW